MYNNINITRKNLMTERNLIRAFIIFALIGLILWSILLTVHNAWSDFLVYPEEDYQLSEKVAEEIATNEDVLNDSFKSEHKVTITLYDRENKRLNFTVQAKSSTRSVEVSIINYRESNQTFTITRNQNNLGRTGFYILSHLCVIILIPAIIGAILLGIYSVIINLLGFICWIIHKIVTYVKRDERPKIE